MTSRLFGIAVVALCLAGCAETLRPRAVTVEQPRAPVEAERPAVPVPAEPSRLAEQLARIAGELGELQNAVAKVMAASRQHEDQLLHFQRRLGELESQTRNHGAPVPGGFAPAGAPPGAPPAPLGSASTAPAEDLYQAGAEKLKAKDWDAAILIFYDLIATHPDHALRENAQFLVADTLYGRKDHRGALAEFEALLAALPKGVRVPEALLKIGLCQRALGDGARARRTWERVIREFPGSVAARQARVLLRS